MQELPEDPEHRPCHDHPGFGGIQSAYLRKKTESDCIEQVMMKRRRQNVGQMRTHPSCSFRMTLAGVGDATRFILSRSLGNHVSTQLYRAHSTGTICIPTYIPAHWHHTNRGWCGPTSTLKIHHHILRTTSSTSKRMDMSTDLCAHDERETDPADEMREDEDVKECVVNTGSKPTSSISRQSVAYSFVFSSGFCIPSSSKACSHSRPQRFGCMKRNTSPRKK